VLIQVISSTTREGRFSERTAHWVARQAADVSDTTAFAPLEPKLSCSPTT
jgi:hypothetical protein